MATPVVPVVPETPATPVILTPVLPVVGSSGFYKMAAPFDALVVNNIEYSCKAIRRISDYLANNEKVKEDVYEKQGLEESVYEEDLKSDTYIVSLQSRTGHWLYVPYRYILSYPSVNGVQYRSVMVGISLPAMPASQDLSAMISDVKDLVETTLGVTVAVKQVETSKVVMIPPDVHALKQQERAMAISSMNTLFAINRQLQKTNDALVMKVLALENYIKLNHTP